MKLNWLNKLGMWLVALPSHYRLSGAAIILCLFPVGFLVTTHDFAMGFTLLIGASTITFLITFAEESLKKNEDKKMTTIIDDSETPTTPKDNEWIETAATCCASLILKRYATIYESTVVEEALRKILRQPSAKDKCFASVEGRLTRCSLPFGHDGQHRLDAPIDASIFSD